MSDLDARLARLSPQQRSQLLARLKAKRDSGQPRVVALTARPPDEPALLSFGQQRLWLLDQIDPGAIVYNTLRGLRLSGDLQRDVLKESLNTLLTRHDILRTVYHDSDSLPVQLVKPSVEFVLRDVDLTSVPVAERDAACTQEAQALARQRISLAEGPLIHGCLLQLERNAHMLVIVAHHSVFDGWSWNLFVDQLNRAYHVLARGDTIELERQKLQYADFAAWQRRQFVADASMRDSVAFWSRYLDRPAVALDVAADRSSLRTSGTESAAAGSAVRVTWPRRFAEQLTQLAAEREATLFMALAAGLGVLLTHQTRETDLRIETPVAGRSLLETEEMIGFFVNTVILRLDAAGEPSFAEFLGRVRQVALGVYEHAHLPFEKIVEAARPNGTAADHGLAQVSLQLRNYPQALASESGLRMERVELESPFARLDLEFAFEHTSAGLECVCRFRRERYEPETVEWLLAQYQRLLCAAVVDSSVAIASLASTSQNQPLAAVAANKNERPCGQASIAERFAEVVRKHGPRGSVRSPRYRWSYDELDRRSTAVAAAVHDRLGDRDGRVALLLEHDAPMVAVLLGVVKAGKTFVPMHTKEPRERLAAILSDADAELVIADSAHEALARQAAGAGRTVIICDQILEASTSAEAVAGHRDHRDHRPAYLLYTSGSTAAPKAVVQSERALLHHVDNYQRMLDARPSDRFLLLAAYTFDAFLLDTFGALLAGAELLPWGFDTDGATELEAWISNANVTVFHSTPTVFRALWSSRSSADREQTALGSRDGADLVQSSLRAVVLGGEPATRADFDVFRAVTASDCTLFNLYGSTECSLVSWARYSHTSDVRRERLSIGEAVRGVRMSLRNATGDETDIRGQICVESEFLAASPHAWLGRGECSSASERPRAKSTRRSLNTGDDGRARPDGGIEVLQRLGLEVKVRGQRVDVAPIEEALCEHESIDAAALRLWPDAHGGRLAAYFVTAAGVVPTSRQLDEFLRTKLSTVMIPSHYVQLESLPLTTSMKVNRRALPAICDSADDLETGDRTRVDRSGGLAGTRVGARRFEPPRSETERRLATIWCHLLGVERVGIADDFFELGGHSLLALELVRHVKREFRAELSLASVFQSPALEGMAAALDVTQSSPPSASSARSRSRSSSTEILVPLRDGGDRSPLICVHCGKGRVHHYVELAKRLEEGVPVLAVQPPMRAFLDARPATVEALAALYVDELVTRVPPLEPYRLCGYSFGGLVALEMARQLRSRGCGVSLLAVLDTSLPSAFLRRTDWKQHAQALDALSPTAKFGYLLRSGVGNLTTSARAARQRLRRLALLAGGELCHRLGRSLPVKLEAEHFFECVTRPARKRYRPGIYDGQVVLFRAEEVAWINRDRPDLGWGEVASGGVTVVSVAGSHHEVLAAENLECIADRLNAHLTAC